MNESVETVETGGPLREALTAAGYTHGGVVTLLGQEAHAALERDETVPALRRTADGSSLATLVRLWLLQVRVPAASAEQALPGLVDRLTATGVLLRDGDEVAAAIDVRPYAVEGGPVEDLWVASDLTPGLDGLPVELAADHVLGVSSAATSLTEMTPRLPVGRALDLGTGCGVQALHLAAHAGRVVATDVNPRALALTRFNAALNGLDLDVREGSLFEPVAGEKFDQVVTNPPFVISPGTGTRLVYRDSGMPGDQVVERIVRGAPAHLNEGGTLHVLGNWAIRRGEPWQERLTRWLGPYDAWVVQRETCDLPAYVELWLRDAGVRGRAEYVARYDAWLGWLEEQGIEAVGMGWIHLRRSTGGRQMLEEWPYQVAAPVWPEVAEALGPAPRLAGLEEAELIGLRVTRRADVRQETFGEPGAGDPERIVLRQHSGMCRARQVDTAEAALVGACDGELTLGQILDALDRLVPGLDRAALVSAVRSLCLEGYLRGPAAD